MTCAEVRETLYELFGPGELPGDVKVHLADCRECRQIWEELRTVGAHFDEEDAFDLSDRESARLMAAINNEIDKSDQTRESSLPRWLQLAAPVAAAAVLLLSIVITGGQFEARLSDSIDSLILSIDETTTAQEALYDDLDEATINVLLEDFSARPSAEPSNRLLEDLTEEEYEYLAKNFDVGDIL